MDWADFMQDEFEKEYMKKLSLFLKEELSTNKVYPPVGQIFSAFNFTPLSKVRVVILGQDPYHGEDQACGLAFSVNTNVLIPPSLRNIYKELNSDLGLEIPKHGDLRRWTTEGVLLLNDTLTVRKGLPGSHRNKGWETFTDAAIDLLNKEKTGLIFLLWGKYAQNKAARVDRNKHHILTAAHPSPYSASNGFFGCKHFSKVNQILTNMNQKTINWKV